MNDTKTKQQVIDKIKDATNILVTVSSSPSVDELSSALGLTLFLNKLGKHATAIFSGEVPPAITFLDPEKTFEDTADSLRDFIIALDKEKADHLRYKLDGDVVKIFITPYRTTITGDDLEFSQGDYNVELVLGLGVENQEHLDTALDAHGRILHDATVVTVTAGEQTSTLGSVDWHEDGASSIAEMLVSVCDGLKKEKGIDESIATAFLTGIVASTERFSNTRTSSKVMTIAAQLMAAGADQQLIASKLQGAEALPPESEPATAAKEETKLVDGDAAKIERKKETKAPKKKAADDGQLTISHEKKGTLDEIAAAVHEEKLAEAEKAATEALNDVAPTEVSSAPVPPVPEPVTAPEPPKTGGAVAWTPGDPAPVAPPVLGGTLNATTSQAEEDKKRAIEDEKNRTILTHSYIGGDKPTYDSPINSAVEAQEEPLGTPADEGLFAKSETVTPSAEPIIPAPIVSEPPVPAPSVPTLADLDAVHRAPVPSGTDMQQEAQAAAEAALSAAIPTADAATIPPPPPPPIPDFSTLPPPPVTPERLGDIFAPEPQAQPAAAPTDPGQFKIPGQQ